MGVIKRCLKIETHNNVVRLLFGRIVTSLFITYIVELLQIGFFFRFPKAQHLNWFPTVEMCRFAYSFTAVCHDQRFMCVQNVCESSAGNLQEISQGWTRGIFQSTMEILFCKVLTAAIPASQRFTASTKTCETSEVSFFTAGPRQKSLTVDVNELCPWELARRYFNSVTCYIFFHVQPVTFQSRPRGALYQ